MDTTSENTQKSNLYGAWLTPKGELIPVDFENHYCEALHILGIDINDLSEIPGWRELYSLMYIKKYIRLIFQKSGGFVLEILPNQSITWQQKSYIKNAAKIGYM